MEWKGEPVTTATDKTNKGRLKKKQDKLGLLAEPPLTPHPPSPNKLGPCYMVWEYFFGQKPKFVLFFFLKPSLR